MIALHSLPSFMHLFTGENGEMNLKSCPSCLSVSFSLSISLSISLSLSLLPSLPPLSIHCLSVKGLAVLCNVTVSLKDKTGSDMNLLTYSSSPAPLRALTPPVNPQPLASLSALLSVTGNIQHFSSLPRFQEPANSQNYTCGDFRFN